jgi:hypothetical protein
MPVSEDASWLVATDRAAATAFAPPLGFDEESLPDLLAEGDWARDDRFGWAILVDGEPAGLALVTSDGSGDAMVSLRISPGQRGRGGGRVVAASCYGDGSGALPAMVAGLGMLLVGLAVIFFSIRKR